MHNSIFDLSKIFLAFHIQHARNEFNIWCFSAKFLWASRNLIFFSLIFFSFWNVYIFIYVIRIWNSYKVFHLTWQRWIDFPLVFFLLYKYILVFSFFNNFSLLKNKYLVELLLVVDVLILQGLSRGESFILLIKNWIISLVKSSKLLIYNICFKNK